jgi:hypothetical protein
MKVIREHPGNVFVGYGPEVPGERMVIELAQVKYPSKTKTQYRALSLNCLSCAPYGCTSKSINQTFGCTPLFRFSNAPCVATYEYTNGLGGVSVRSGKRRGNNWNCS